MTGILWRQIMHPIVTIYYLFRHTHINLVCVSLMYLKRTFWKHDLVVKSSQDFLSNELFKCFSLQARLNQVSILFPRDFSLGRNKTILSVILLLISCNSLIQNYHSSIFLPLSSINLLVRRKVSTHFPRR